MRARGLPVARRLDEENEDVGVARRLAGRLVHPLAEPRPRLVQAGRVDEDELRVARGEHAPHGVARGLRVEADDRDRLAQQRIEQRALADVGPADERDAAGAGRGAGRGGLRGELCSWSRCGARPTAARGAASAGARF